MRLTTRLPESLPNFSSCPDVALNEVPMDKGDALAARASTLLRHGPDPGVPLADLAH
jgi:hypothetical protein